MPHFTLPIGPDGPVLNAYVLVSPPRAQALRDAGQPVPPPVPILALVDTGASCTCIDPSVMAQLGLTPTGSVPINTPSTGTTPHTADQYDVSLVIPGSAPGQPPLIFDTISVVASQLSFGQNLQALIGRDILQRCILHYNGDRRFFSLCY